MSLAFRATKTKNQAPGSQAPAIRGLPTTRFQGSKRKLVGWILNQIADIEFETALDAFGGTGSVAYGLKRLGKAITYNDILRCNHWTGTALIENHGARLSTAAAHRIATGEATATDDDLIERTFAGVYFTDDENRWLDRAVQGVARLRPRGARAIACHALFQAALAKRPYNLFHRGNLYMRQADVSRSFGNKTTWDRPFAEHFGLFVEETNNAAFESDAVCRAIRGDAIDAPGDYDLVYIDPPYVNGRRVGVDYLDFYHFLEGMSDYKHWERRIDFKTKHRRMRRTPNPWTSAGAIHGAFERIVRRFADSVLVVSYRSDGIPSIEELVSLIRRVKSRVDVRFHDSYQYALSTNRRSREALIIGR